MNNDTYPVLAIHGLWGDRSQWNNWPTQFADRDFYTIDLEGHGKNSGANLNRVSILDYATYVITYIETNIGGPTDLVGHSAGALIAQLVAALRPDLVHSVTLLASSLFKEIEAKLPLQFAFFRPSLVWALVWGTTFTPSKSAAEVVLHGLPFTLGAESGLAIKEVMRKKISVRRLSCPMHVIAAENDQFLPVHAEEQIAWYHGTRAVVLPGEHMFHCDERYQGAVMNSVKAFLDDLVTHPATAAQAA